MPRRKHFRHIKISRQKEYSQLNENCIDWPTISNSFETCASLEKPEDYKMSEKNSKSDLYYQNTNSTTMSSKIFNVNLVEGYFKSEVEKEVKENSSTTSFESKEDLSNSKNSMKLNKIFQDTSGRIVAKLYKICTSTATGLAPNVYLLICDPTTNVKWFLFDAKTENNKLEVILLQNESNTSSKENLQWPKNEQLFLNMNQLQMPKKCLDSKMSINTDDDNNLKNGTEGKNLSNYDKCTEFVTNNYRYHLNDLTLPYKRLHLRKKAHSETSLIDFMTYCERTISTSGIDCTNSNVNWHSSPQSSKYRKRISNLKDKKSEVDSFFLSNNFSCINGVQESTEFNSKKLKCSFFKICMFCSWMTKKIFNYIIQGFKNICTIFSTTNIALEETQLLAHELSHAINSMRSQNQNISILMEKINYLSNELNQIRMSSETSLTALTEKVSRMHNANEKLVEKNSNLAEQMKSLQETLKTVKELTSSKPLLSKSTTTLCEGDGRLPSPPPPPPPPPLPPFSLSQSLKEPLLTNIKNGKKNTETNAYKSSTTSLPGSSRPTITVEDLMKVTLKKAPQNQSKESLTSSISGTPNKGPAISLDMLRSVKLRSIRRRNSDQILRSPRRGTNRLAKNLVLTPLTSGSENNLLHILNAVDVNKRFRKTAFNPAQKEPEKLLESNEN